jgi:hypothetical protein
MHVLPCSKKPPRSRKHGCTLIPLRYSCHTCIQTCHASHHLSHASYSLANISISDNFLLNTPLSLAQTSFSLAQLVLSASSDPTLSSISTSRASRSTIRAFFTSRDFCAARRRRASFVAGEDEGVVRLGFLVLGVVCGVGGVMVVVVVVVVKEFCTSGQEVVSVQQPISQRCGGRSELTSSPLALFPPLPSLSSLSLPLFFLPPLSASA